MPMTMTTTTTTRHGMRRVTESHVTTRDRPRQPGPWRWPRRRVIWSCTAARGPLLTRYYLLETRWLGVYLHQLHASDDDRALHDHPWSFVSILFHHGYWEHGDAGGDPARGVWHPRGSVLWRPAEWRHRLRLAERPTWTLVLRFRRRRAWGFITPQGWQDWQAYGKEWCD
jgi:hypothetical protein